MKLWGLWRSEWSLLSWQQPSWRLHQKKSTQVAKQSWKWSSSLLGWAEWWWAKAIGEEKTGRVGLRKFCKYLWVLNCGFCICISRQWEPLKIFEQAHLMSMTRSVFSDSWSASVGGMDWRGKTEVKRSQKIVGRIQIKIKNMCPN